MNDTQIDKAPMIAYNPNQTLSTDQDATTQPSSGHYSSEPAPILVDIRAEDFRTPPLPTPNRKQLTFRYVFIAPRHGSHPGLCLPVEWTDTVGWQVRFADGTRRSVRTMTPQARCSGAFEIAAQVVLGNGVTSGVLRITCVDESDGGSGRRELVHQIANAEFSNNAELARKLRRLAGPTVAVLKTVKGGK
jgi:hypothetical protein